MIRWPNSAFKAHLNAVAVVIAAIGIHGSCMCSSSSDAASSTGDSGFEDADAFASGGQSGGDAERVERDARDPEAIKCDQEEWSGLPGWKLNRDWSCACRLFDPEPGTELPEWGRWEKCPELGPRDVDCRVIVPPSDYKAGLYGASLDNDENSGQTKLAMIYSGPNSGNAKRSTIFVFDVDGPTLNAMVVDRPPSGGCDAYLRGMNQGKVVVRVVGKDPWVELDFSQQAVLGGDVYDPMAKLVYQWDPPPSGSWALSAFASSELLVIATPTFGRAAADWKTMQWREIWEKDPEGLMVGDTVVWGKNVFFGVNAGGLGGFMSWDPEHGLRPLLRRYGDRLERSSNFGTDGKDMVWTLGRRKEPRYGVAPYDQYFVMTAPFTTDPAVVASQARVVREEQDGSFIPDTAYRVGCGYAAHITRKSDLVVTRLSDGAEWIVKRLLPPDQHSWTFGRVLGVTCDEIFLPFDSREGYYPDTSTLSIARIRIDSLGVPSFPAQ